MNRISFAIEPVGAALVFLHIEIDGCDFRRLVAEVVRQSGGRVTTHLPDSLWLEAGWASEYFGWLGGAEPRSSWRGHGNRLVLLSRGRIPDGEVNYGGAVTTQGAVVRWQRLAQLPAVPPPYFGGARERYRLPDVDFDLSQYAAAVEDAAAVASSLLARSSPDSRDVAVLAAERRLAVVEALLLALPDRETLAQIDFAERDEYGREWARLTVHKAYEVFGEATQAIIDAFVVGQEDFDPGTLEDEREALAERIAADSPGPSDAAYVQVGRRGLRAVTPFVQSSTDEIRRMVRAYHENRAFHARRRQ